MHLLDDTPPFKSLNSREDCERCFIYEVFPVVGEEAEDVIVYVQFLPIELGVFDTNRIV